MLSNQSLVLVGLGSLAFLAYALAPRSRNPPGPPGVPVFGNALNWPKHESWKAFFEWSKQYGDVVYTTVFTRRMIIINSTSAVQDLLERRASVYSQRPYQYLFEVSNRLLSVFNIPTEHARFRTYRRLLHGELAARAQNGAPELLRRQTLRMLQHIAKEPELFQYYIRLNTGSTVLRLTYGYDTLAKQDPFIMQTDRALAGNTQATAIWLADYYPILRYLPMWLAPWKRQGIAMGREIERNAAIPYNWFRERMASDEYKDCFTSRQWLAAGEKGPDPEQADIIMNVATAIYAGGVDTVSSALATFVLLMTLHPDVQEKARAELDASIGRDRLPTEADFGRKDMPYVAAVIKETLRWAPPVPLGLPHCAISDDEYRGYHIKKGTLMIPNIWGMLRDEAVYPEPDAFTPERHLGPHAQPDPLPFVFGFGRRVCPGMHFGQLQLFLNVCAILAVFEISKARDAQGREVEPRVAWKTSLVTRLEPFECRLQVRRDAEHLLDGPTAW